MSKRIILVLFGFVFLFSYNLVLANPIINEFMYDLDGADIDWVEIYNGDSNDIDLTTFKLLISNSESNHGIIKYSGSQNLHEGEYGVIIPTSQISAFISRWGNSGNLFTSSFSLPNESATIEINNGDKNSPLDSVSYTFAAGGSGDGNSLSGSLIPGVPTPGAENQNSESGGNDNGGNDGSGNDDGGSGDTNNASSSSEDKIKKVEAPLVNKTKIIVKQPAFVGVPVEFIANNTVSDNSCGKYFWNFGDGSSEETEKVSSIPKKFTHIYYYSGEYIVSLECYKSYLSSEPDTSDKITLKVVSTDILISKVGDEKDFFIEISNNTSFEADLSDWYLLSYLKKFVFPKNTIIKSKSKVILSSKTTGFSISDKNTLRLFNSQGEIISDYSAFFEPTKILARSPISKKDSAIKKGNGDLSMNNIGIEMPANNLLTSAIKSDTDVKDNFGYGILGLFVFLGIGTSAVYFIRNRGRKPVLTASGDDFEIIDG